MLSNIELSVLLHRTFTVKDVYDQHGDEVVCFNKRDWLELRAEVLRMRQQFSAARDGDLQDKIDNLIENKPCALTPLILL